MKLKNLKKKNRKKIRRNNPASLKTVFKIHLKILRDYRYYKFLLFVDFIVSLVISIIIVFNSTNIYTTIAEFGKLILPFYAISIGFTITSATFLINSINKERYMNNIDNNYENKKNLKELQIKLNDVKKKYTRVISLVIFYVIYALLLLLILFLQILIAKYIIIELVFLKIINFLSIFLYFFLIFYSFILFFLIVYSFYLFSLTYITSEIDEISDKK